MKEIRTRNQTDAEVEGNDYVQESAVYLKDESHGGDDVPIYSSGPMSFLFDGTVEQSFVAHAIAYSTCIGAYNNAECQRERGAVESSGFQMALSSVYAIWILLSAAFILC